LIGKAQMVTLTPQEICQRVAPVLRRHGVDKAILFGSFARGEATRHSDVDLLLVKETTDRFLDRTRGLWEELNRAFPERAVEVLIYTPSELQAMSGRKFIESILREGKVIYEQNQPTA